MTKKEALHWAIMLLIESSGPEEAINILEAMHDSIDESCIEQTPDCYFGVKL